MEEIKFRCKMCFAKVAAPESMAGGRFECPACKRAGEVPSPMRKRGDVIDGFEIDHWVGAGASGEVYYARQLSTDRVVALKMIPDANIKDEEDRARLQREMSTLAKLNHPNIVGAIAAGRCAGGFYLAMTFVEGITVEDLIAKDGRLEWQRALRIAKDVAEGLRYAWDTHYILHRDLKPQNVIVDISGQTMLTDMGIAKSMASDNDITAVGMVVGTPYYMSPEQASADDLDCRSDIYSLGAFLYHAVSGVQPYSGLNSMQVMMEKLTRPPAVLSCPDVPVPVLDYIQKRLMARKANDRPADWKQVVDQLDALLQGCSAKASAKATAPAAKAPASAAKAPASAAKAAAQAQRKKGGCMGILALGLGLPWFAYEVLRYLA